MECLCELPLWWRADMAYLPLTQAGLHMGLDILDPKQSKSIMAFVLNNHLLSVHPLMSHSPLCIVLASMVSHPPQSPHWNLPSFSSWTSVLSRGPPSWFYQILQANHIINEKCNRMYHMKKNKHVKDQYRSLWIKSIIYLQSRRMQRKNITGCILKVQCCSK